LAYEESLGRISGIVNANESAAQYMAFSFNSAGQYALSAAGVAVDGVLQDDPGTTGFVGMFGIYGVSKMLVGPNGITAGQAGQVDTNGGVTSYTSGVRFCRALATGVSGDNIPVRLHLALA
jgi:hypothetical protein